MKIVFKKDLELAAGVCVHLWGFLYCCPFPSFNLGNACSAKTAGQLEEFTPYNDFIHLTFSGLPWMGTRPLYRESDENEIKAFIILGSSCTKILWFVSTLLSTQHLLLQMVVWGQTGPQTTVDTTLLVLTQVSEGASTVIILQKFLIYSLVRSPALFVSHFSWHHLASVVFYDQL